VIQQVAATTETDTDLLAEQARVRIEKNAKVPDLITQFSA
jgi:hypothetical protein